MLNPRITKWLVPLVGYSIAITSLVWVFHTFDYAQLEQRVRTLNWGWAVLGIALNLFVSVIDGWRWAILLSPAEEAPVGECTKAVFIGLAANGVLPGKAGEIIRCYLLSRWTDTPLSIALTSHAIGRVMDGICLVAGFYIVTVGVVMPAYLRDYTMALGIGVAVLSALFIYVLFRREHATSFMSANKWAAKFKNLLHEIHSLGSWRTLGAALGLSVMILFLQMVSVWVLFRAYTFDFSLAQAGVVLTIAHIGTSLPNAPGNIGSFQFFVTVALDHLQAEKSEAKIFSVILYFAHILAQIATGAIVLLFTGLKLGEVHMHARRAKDLHKSGSSAAPDSLS